MYLICCVSCILCPEAPLPLQATMHLLLHTGTSNALLNQVLSTSLTSGTISAIVLIPCLLSKTSISKVLLLGLLLHADYINGPIYLHGMEGQVDVMIESKAKELALLKYRQQVLLDVAADIKAEPTDATANDMPVGSSQEAGDVMISQPSDGGVSKMKGRARGRKVIPKKAGGGKGENAVKEEDEGVADGELGEDGKAGVLAGSEGVTAAAAKQKPRSRKRTKQNDVPVPNSTVEGSV